MEVDLELDKAVAAITEHKAKTVVLQLPDGLKPKAKEIADHLTKKTGAQVTIWLGSNFGGCDFPIELHRFGFDLLIAWGHAVFRK